MSDRGDLLYIIGIGDAVDWQAGRGSLYYIEDKNGERALPVFTTSELANNFVQTNFNIPEAHMQMLESVGATHAAPLTAGHFMIMSVRTEEGLSEAAAAVGADYLMRDIRPGDEQEIMRLT